MNPTLLKLWGARYGQLVLDASIPEDLREDTLCLAAYLVGPLVLARSYDVPCDRAGGHRAWADTLSEDLRRLPDMLATIGLSARLPTWGPDSPITPLVPRCAPFILPMNASGVAMFKTAMTVAELEVAYMFRPDDEDPPPPAELADNGVPSVQHETETPPECADGVTSPLAGGETPRESNDGASEQTTH